MTTLTDANKQWASRPAEERFTSLLDMQQHFAHVRAHSRGAVVSSRSIAAAPAQTEDGKVDPRGLLIYGPGGNAYAPTHHAFGQLATLAGAPAGYLRKLPSPVAADCINYGLKVERDVEDVGVLLYKNGAAQLRAATGPNYGRIWNDDVVRHLVNEFGDGIHGRFRVSGEFGQQIEVTKDNTTLYAGDRDMFVFLADEENRIEIPNRRDGQAGSLARGFIVFNSEVGDLRFGVKTFLFDYVCSNRIIWGAQDVQEITLRHTAKAPDRFLEEVQPALLSYANSSARGVTAAIEQARERKIDKIEAFLATRYGAKLGARIAAAHEQDEGRPIETAWDVVTGVTAYARSIGTQQERVALEEDAGKLLKLS